MKPFTVTDWQSPFPHPSLESNRLSNRTLSRTRGPRIPRLTHHILRTLGNYFRIGNWKSARSQAMFIGPSSEHMVAVEAFQNANSQPHRFQT